MALNAGGTDTVLSLTRFILVSADAARLADFYERAFGCRTLDIRHPHGPAFERLLDVSGGALSITLALGNEIIELLEFDRPGCPYPEASSSSDLIFQHLAIVVRNMDAAYAQLSRLQRWTAISQHGPERLPESSGGVAAFKFRDPEGHPLELLAFPDAHLPARWQRSTNEPWLGIDHSAISVADTGKSVAFYEALGLSVASRAVNRGPAQAGLDALGEPHVEVTALRPPHVSPHVELLYYRSPAPDHGESTASSDIAATRLVFECLASPHGREHDRVTRSACDPDGHRLLLLAPSR